MMAELADDLDAYAYRMGLPKRKSIIVIFLYPTCWPIVVYRFGNYIGKSKSLKKILVPIYFLSKRIVEILTKIEISEKSEIGGGLFIPHFGSIVIGHGSIIGKNLSIHQGVTIGGDGKGSGSPKIGDNCYLGVGCIIIGDVILGDNVVIGAGSVVVKSIPNNAVAIGVPARIINFEGSTDYVHYRK